MKTINQIIGENLKKIRELSGFTQEQIAKSIGIERSAYSNYEGGTREVPYLVVSLLFCLKIMSKQIMRFWLRLSEFPI